MSPRLAIVGGQGTRTHATRRGLAAASARDDQLPRLQRRARDTRASSAGRGGAEYWTLRCVSCGGIHLDIVKGPAPS